jgi:ParB-like chromosome segregation protein Spo0J
MNLKLVDINKIKINPRNRNKHPEAQIEALAQKIFQVGMRVPVIVNEDYMLISGHCRLEACKKLDLAQIPCLIQEFDDEAEEYVFGITDNVLGKMSRIDYEGINSDLPDFGPGDFSIDDLLLDFEFEPDPEESHCPTCGKKLRK